MRQMVARILKFMGINSDVAGDGFQALEKLRENSYDIVIADIRMPSMDGMELLKLIRKDYTGTDVLVMTAHSSKYSYVDVVESGASDFISKPFSVEELKAKIERIARERSSLNELAKKTTQLEKAYAEMLALKDEEGRTCPQIGYEREFLVQEIDRLREDAKRLAAALHGEKS